MASCGRISLKGIAILLAAILVSVILIKCTVSYVGAEFGSVSQEEAADFLEELGWKLETDTAYSAEVAIPAEFSEVYQRYNNLQKKQGYDLSAYRGETVIRYTFNVLNFKEQDGSIAENAEAHVLVFGGKIIGGDLCSTAINGLMTGFKGESC